MHSKNIDIDLLTVKNLSLDVLSEQGRFPLIRNISFSVRQGKVLGIVGESGSGKTVTCLSLTRLLPQPPIYYLTGEVLFEGQDLWKISQEDLRHIRGSGIANIFQEALSALNPVISVGKQVSEVLTIHTGISKKEAHDRTIELFQQVGIPSPEVRFQHYPHQLSGGLQQRAMIAMALAGNPRLLIADEPTTALDVTIQVQIIELLRRLQRERNMSIIFISHDLGLISELCDDVLVMYAGEMIEYSSLEELFAHPAHPYTHLLLNSIPRLDRERGKLIEIPGQVPSPANYPSGCKFHPRCPYAREKCNLESPITFNTGEFHQHRCWFPLLTEQESQISK
jgi:oligopeptide/dipeptide ABC transporter ATP-binding protein